MPPAGLFAVCAADGARPDLVGFVVSLNLHRRHLNESQRAVIAAEIATMRRGANRFTKVDADISTARAAELLNISRDSVVKARKVLDHGTPEEIEAVREGRAALFEDPEEANGGGAADHAEPETDLQVAAAARC
ncbi:MAG: hypothetical protein Kow00114_32830 [Kiloniellaceae bacterium]